MYSLRMARREFVTLLGKALAALAVLKLVSQIPRFARKNMLRPPSAVKEGQFDNLCIRCGICLQVCPTNTIVLAGFEDGVASVSTPKLDLTAGPCEYFRGRCEEEMQCGQFCPTGALRHVNKEDVRIGTLQFTADWCLAYQEKECVICHEMCPVPDAITLTEGLQPVFHDDLCIGCGSCVYYCPAEPRALTLQPTR